MDSPPHPQFIAFCFCVRATVLRLFLTSCKGQRSEIPWCLFYDEAIEDKNTGCVQGTSKDKDKKKKAPLSLYFLCIL